MSSGITGQYSTNFGWAYNAAMNTTARPSLLPVGIGLIAVAGVMLWAVRTNDPAPVASAIPAATQPPDVIEVRAVLELPTATATPIPTMEPTHEPTTDVTINYCGTVTPGALCQLPPLSTATATPYPLCSEASPGQWCRQDDL